MSHFEPGTEFTVGAEPGDPVVSIVREKLFTVRLGQLRAPERQLRIVQVGCALVLLEYFRVGRTIQVTQTSSLVQWIVIALALSCAVNGFLIQRVIVGGPRTRQHRFTKSTPFTRWRAGNLVRLLLATSVGLYGFILRMFGGPHWQANCLLALGMILLFVWKPGQSPNSQIV